MIRVALKKFAFLFTLLFLGLNVNAQLTWTQQNSTSTTQFVDKVDFVNENVGYTLLYPSIVLSTVNGGNTWTPTTIAGSDLNALSFVDTQTGWAIDYVDASIYKTINGGSTWQPVYTNPFFSGYAYDIHFVDANHGYATRTDYFLYTDDGGSTWDSITTPGGADLYFLNQQNGFILNGNYLHSTQNGGTVWSTSTIHTGTEYINGFCAIDALNIWAVGELGIMKHTIDGGNNWVTKNSGVTTELQGVKFFDEYNGVAVGNGGVVITTADGGSNWVTNTSGVGADLYQLDMVSAGQAWVTGASGTIISSTAYTDVQIQDYLGDTLVCIGANESILLWVKNDGSSPITSGNFSLSGSNGSSLNYNWSGLLMPGTDDQIDIGSVTILQGESFVVTFSGDSDSSNNDFNFSIDKAGDEVTFSGPHMVCPGDSVTMSVTGAETVVWPAFVLEFDTSITFVPTSYGSYEVIAEDNFGCPHTGNIQVDLYPTCDTAATDTSVYDNTNIAITPNNDGKNDFLYLEGIENNSNTVRIYNRWGDLIKTIKDYDNESNNWDCTYLNGGLVAAGTYFFTLEIPDLNVSETGWLQVIP